MAGIKQIALRLPYDLATEADARAEAVGVSRNEWLTRAVRWALTQPVTTRTRQETV